MKYEVTSTYNAGTTWVVNAIPIALPPTDDPMDDFNDEFGEEIRLLHVYSHLSIP
jgi:hypothetical protein